MAFKLPEFTKESTNAVGSDPYGLQGAESGFKPFSATLANGDTTLYTVKGGGANPDFAVYFGEYDSALDELSRGLLLISSTGADIVWPDASAKIITCAEPGILVATLFALLEAGSTGGLKLVSGSPVPTFAAFALTAFAETLLDDADAATMRATLTAMARSFSDQTLLTTSGDLLAFTSSPVRLARGTSGQFLKTVGTLLAWATPAASEISYTPTAPLVGTTPQAALDEIAVAAAARTFAKKTSDEADAASETVVAGLSNITIPGTPDGSKKYRAHGQLLLTNGGAGNQYAIARVRVGTNGDVTDAIVWEGAAHINNSGDFMLPIVIPEFTPAASTKLSVTFVEGDSTIRGDATILESFIEISRILA